MVAEILQFFIFSRLRTAAILDLWSAFWIDPERVLGGVLHCARFGLNRTSALIVRKFLYFVHLPWLYSTPKMGDFYAFDPQNGVCCQRDPNRHILAWKDVTCRMNC